MTATTTTSSVERIRANAWGRYYVSSECDGCGVCAFYAPFNFASSFDRAYFGVIHQPDGDAEGRDVRAAMEACPLHCIHDDGDDD